MQQRPEDTMRDRIRLVMEQEKLSQQDFAQKLGVSPASLSSIFTGRTNPTTNHARAIHTAFPLINITWLMFGEGEMMLETGRMGDGSSKGVTGKGLPYAEGEQSLAFETDSPRPDDRAPRVTPPYQNLNGASSCLGNGLHVSTDLISQMIDKEAVSKVPKRRIKEIRVFFDDGTYESFVASK